MKQKITNWKYLYAISTSKWQQKIRVKKKQKMQIQLVFIRIMCSSTIKALKSVWWTCCIYFKCKVEEANYKIEKY